MIQNKELYGRSRFGRLIKGNQTRNPSDWWSIDRLDWPNWRSAPLKNSFIRAVIVSQKSSVPSLLFEMWCGTFLGNYIYNTEHNRPDEYSTVTQRHYYYRRVANFLIQAGYLSPNVRGVQFFEAAAMTTGQLGISGAVRSIGGHITHSAATQNVMKQINRILFRANMRIINQLKTRQKPTDPINQRDQARISTLQFDLKMVEMEQVLVQAYLNQHQLAPESCSGSECRSQCNWCSAHNFRYSTFSVFPGEICIGR